MTIERDHNKLCVSITDKDLASWRDGVAMFWKIDRDDRPEWVEVRE